MEGIAQTSVVVSREFPARPSAVDDLVAFLESDNFIRNLSADRIAALDDHCLLVYRELFPIVQNKRTFPLTITLSDQTQLTISQTESGLTFDVEGKIVASNIPKRAALVGLYKQIQSSSHFVEILKHEECYRKLGWEGNFYYKNLPSPKQLMPGYKREPYVTIDEHVPVNLNGRAFFSQVNPADPGGTIIFCRHLSTKCVEDVSQDKSGRGKFNFVHYHSQEAISNHVTVKTDALFAEWRTNASSYDLIDNNLLGKQIQRGFLNMIDITDSVAGFNIKSSIKTLLLVTTDHVMMIRLRLKTDRAGRPIFVLKFYDPNTTNKTVRVETDDLSTFEFHSLKQYIAGTKWPSNDSRYLSYFDGDTQICMVMDCENRLSDSSKRKLNNALVGTITSHHIYHLLQCNLADDLFGLIGQLNEIGKVSPTRLIELLEAKILKGVPALSLVGQRGVADGIKTFGELILMLSDTISPEQQLELLAAKRGDGSSVLLLMAQLERAEAIRSYGDVIVTFARKVSPTKLMELLVALSPKCFPVLNIMVQKADAASVKAYSELLLKLVKIISPDQLVHLLVAKSAGGVPVLITIAEKGLLDSIYVYGDFIAKFIPIFSGSTMVRELVGPNNQFRDRLLKVLSSLTQDKNVMSITAFQELDKKLAPHLRNKRKVGAKK